MVHRHARPLGVEERPPKLLLMGRHVLDLGLRPGPRVGEIIRAVYEMQLDGGVVTLDDAIEAARKSIGRGDGREGLRNWN